MDILRVRPHQWNVAWRQIGNIVGDPMGDVRIKTSWYIWGHICYIVERHLGNKRLFGETVHTMMVCWLVGGLWRHPLVHAKTANMSPTKSVPPCLLQCSSTTLQLVTQLVSFNVPTVFCHCCGRTLNIPTEFCHWYPFAMFCSHWNLTCVEGICLIWCPEIF